jgi:hypothetical protein
MKASRSLPNSVQQENQLDERLDSFADLSQYSFRQRLIIRSAGAVLYWLIRLIGSTIRFDIRGSEYVSERQPQIFCFWHNRIPLATYFWRHRRIVVMSSQSFDSEYIARFIQRFGYGAARGSSTRGGKAALIQMIRAVRGGRSAAFSIDGPRGPLYEVKPGALLLSARTGAALLPFSISLDRYWQLPSWDRIQIPKPFARAVVIIGQPFCVPESDQPEDHQPRLQQVLDELRQQSDQAIVAQQ